MPQTQHVVIVRDTNGNKVAEASDFLTLTYSKRVNQKGSFSVLFPGNHSLASAIGDKYLVEIQRRVLDWDIDWYTDFYGVHREPEAFSNGNVDLFKINGHDQFGILDWRRVAWFAGTADRSYFSSEAAETIAKLIVQYNATASATTGAGRERNGPISNFTITIETDAAGGDTLSSLGVAWKDLISALQKCTGRQGGGDIDLIYTGSPGSPAWEFRWYEGQRGTDRSSNILFAVNYGNMEEPYYTINRKRERTVAIVGGKGEGSNRDIVIRTGADYAASNDIEIFVPATDISKGNTTALNAAGDRALLDSQKIEVFSFTPTQTEGYAYGKAYCVDGDTGDLVGARYDHPGYGVISGTFKIVGVDISVSNRGNQPIEQVDLIIEEWS